MRLGACQLRQVHRPVLAVEARRVAAALLRYGTAQEQAVARLVSVGMSNRQVASELFVSVKTVQFHLTHIYAKLGISSRAGLAAQFRDTADAGG